MVQYKYDAWGRQIGCDVEAGNSNATALSTLNPFRYRGYVYDEETAKYYVSNRYYCPENSRWLNSDSRFGDVGKELYGNDMFVYCWNNPICMEDPSGNWPRWITAAVAVVAAVVAVVAAPATATTAAMVSVIATGVYVIQSAHYDDREARNSDLPRSPQEAIDLGWYGPNTDPQGPSAGCHQFTSPDKSNIKYVSPDGHREVIFDSNGNMVVDPKDVGTYNYCLSGTFWGDIGHSGLDILPWIVFGNSDEDPGPAVNIIVDCFD